eukprot:3121266-Karenia_brevis.AAC.1
MTGPRARAPPKVTSINEIRKAKDHKLHLGMTWPRAHPRITSLNEIRKGNDPKLHLGMTGPKGHQERERS